MEFFETSILSKLQGLTLVWLIESDVLYSKINGTDPVKDEHDNLSFSSIYLYRDSYVHHSMEITLTQHEGFQESAERSPYNKFIYLSYFFSTPTFI